MSRQVVKHCGNFSGPILAGMIAYGQEAPGKNPGFTTTAGYATRERDMVLGGFMHVRCAQEAAQQGQNLSSFSLKAKERLALEVAQKHLREHGEASHESFRHWIKRVEAFAGHQKRDFPKRSDAERPYDYFRRLRKWTGQQPERWPELRKAAGTHLVLSPDPQIWEEVRRVGLDERLFLKDILARTMHGFADWRRQEIGPKHSLGWIAGTHVEADGAHLHPHIHVVVLKRDAAGKEVDWSVNQLKGRQGRGESPDPLQKVKDIFEKEVERAYERTVGLPLPTKAKETKPELFRGMRLNPDARRLAKAIQQAARAIRWAHKPHRNADIIGAAVKIAWTISHIRERIRAEAERARQREDPRDQGWER